MSDELAVYKFLAKVGEGGMSTVWKALDETHNQIVAIKVLDGAHNDDPEEVAAFRREAMMMREIRHPGVVQVYDCLNFEGNWCMIMEFVDGYTFSDLLRRKQHVRESDCLLICESVATALGAVWNDHGIVHCDIKPENIMINTSGVVKLADLGISARFVETTDGSKEVPDHVSGTPAYISPEQVYGDVVLDCRSDIYSLAATLYHLATGRVLFPRLDPEESMRAHCDETKMAVDPRAYRPELSEGFCQLLEAMLVKDREHRVASWSAVCQMCREIESGVAFKPRSDAAVSSIKLMDS